TFEDVVKKIHHVILTPSIETAVQVNERLAKYGDLSVDGRPTLDMSAPQLVEEVMEVSKDNMVFPAHAWTPWFSIFGAFSGFNSVEECYQDMAKHIYALETGLSSDPPMNWRLSKLDKFTLVSNSDSHSFWPWRMGREANVFELKSPSYWEVVEAIKNKDKARFKFTVETDPAYGKYHWTGHRNCNVSLSPKEAIKLSNICPVCRKKLTKGVEQRVEELADRPAGFKPENAIGYLHLLPLSEIIATVLNVDSPSTQQVWSIYNRLVEKFGDEYSVLIDAPREALESVVDGKIAEAIIRVREDRIKVVPGYDGVYGRPIIFGDEAPAAKSVSEKVQQLNLTDFM
ncbi:MAG: endonuclease Q family protein, partial [Candidatus Bathyarchaeia archaeon]